MTRSVLVLPALLSALSTGSVTAQTTPSRLETVEIRGSQAPAREADVERTRAELSRAEVEQLGAWSIFDALRQADPSVFVSRRSLLGYGLSSGAGGLVSVRGVGGRPNTAVLTTVDGVPSRMGIFGHPLQDLYTPDMIDRVEVITGPAADLFGGSALAGSINLVSRRRRTEGMESSVSGRHGRYGTWEASLAHGGKRGAWDWYVTGLDRVTDGHLENNSFRQQGLTLRGGWAFAPGFRAWTHLRGGRFAVEDPFQAGTNMRQRVSRRGATLAVEEEREGVQGRAAVYYDWGDHSFTDGWDSRDTTLGFTLSRATRVSDLVTLAGGVDWVRYGGHAWSGNRTIDRGDHYLTEASTHLRAGFHLARGWHLAGGLKALRHSREDLALLPSAGISWRGDADTWQPGLRLTANRGWRAPTINELHFPFPAANRELDPEQVDNLELAFTARVDRLSGRLVLFALEGRDAIVRQGPPPPFAIDNHDVFRHRGVETDLTWRDELWGARLAGSYLHHEGISPGAFRWRLIYSSWYGSAPEEEKQGAWRVRLDGETVHHLWGTPGTASHKEDLSTLSIKASWDLLDNCRLSAGIENLGDARWHEVGNLESIGRSAWVGVRVRF